MIIDRRALFRSLTILLVLAAGSVGAAACTKKVVHIVPGTEGTEDGGANDPARDCEFPKSQTVSQPCCEGWGVDACGANLFCASFDGREQATCYLERSRADMTECSEDRQCTSGECNVEHGKCVSAPGTKCTSEIGCASDPTGARYACSNAESTCMKMGNGDVGEFCTANSECKRGNCKNELCVNSRNEPCNYGSDCESGHCADTCTEIPGTTCEYDDDCFGLECAPCDNIGIEVTVQCVGGKKTGQQCLVRCGNTYTASCS